MPSQLEEEERKKGDVSIPFITKFIFCIFIIIQYSIPVNSTYHSIEINKLPKPDVFSVAPHANISTWCQINRTPPKCSPACQKGRHLTQRKKILSNHCPQDAALCENKVSPYPIFILRHQEGRPSRDIAEFVHKKHAK